MIDLRVPYLIYSEKLPRISISLFFSDLTNPMN